MKFSFDDRPSDSAFVDAIWRTHSEDAGSFISVAESHWGIVVTKQYGKTWFTVRGPETHATPAPVPENAEMFGIIFKLGTFMPHLPARILVDNPRNLPDAASKSFWLNGSAWEFPSFDNADTFINRLVCQGMLERDGVVDAVLQDHPQDVSIRTVRRRFLYSTGLTHKTIQQIQRARRAVSLLEQGVPILDTVYETGYFDQAHLTKSLKYFVGQTPTQITLMNAAQ